MFYQLPRTIACLRIQKTDESEAAVKRKLAWAAICATQPRAGGQLYFRIVQGAKAPELRKWRRHGRRIRFCQVPAPPGFQLREAELRGEPAPPRQARDGERGKGVGDGEGSPDGCGVGCSSKKEQRNASSLSLEIMQLSGR